MQAYAQGVQTLQAHILHSFQPSSVVHRRPRVTTVTSTAVDRLAASRTAAQSDALEWLDVDKSLIWQGNEEAALAAVSPASTLSAPWKMMLLSDGSVTRHLQLLTGQPIKVECLSMELLSQQHCHQPPQNAMQIPGPLVQRQVLLWSQDEPRVPLVYAASWWASASVDKYLANKDLPIWVSLAQGHLELYREIQTVALGHNEALEQQLGCSGPFWSRQYYFWHEGQPLTLIHEVFSNKLEAYLGPQHSNGSSSSSGSGGSGSSGSSSSSSTGSGSGGGGGGSGSGSGSCSGSGSGSLAKDMQISSSAQGQNGASHPHWKFI